MIDINIEIKQSKSPFLTELDTAIDEKNDQPPLTTYCHCDIIELKISKEVILWIAKKHTKQDYCIITMPIRHIR